MALPDLTGLNIEDTYQRVLHTDGNVIYDGTGSIVNLFYTGSYTGSFAGNGSQLTGITATSAPAGPNQSVQFRDGALTSGSANFIFDKSTNTVTITGELAVANLIDTSTTLLTYGGYSSLNWSVRELYNGNGDATVNWEGQELYSGGGGTTTVNWLRGTLNSPTDLLTAVNWDNRRLIGSNGSTVVLNWNNVTGSLIGTSSWANNSVTASFINGGTF